MTSLASASLASFHGRIQRAVALVAPPPPMTVSQWADACRIVSPEVSSSPGRWRTDNAPYLREIMDSVNDHRVERIVVMKAARMGVTECINNTIGYYVDYDPKTILYVQQTIDNARDYSNMILKYLIEDTPSLNRKVAEHKAKSSSTTTMYKTFPGGNIKIVGANSPRAFRGINKEIVVCDDIDGFEGEVAREGDPVDLAIHRADTSPNKKIILVSSPTVRGFSRIELEFIDSDQRYFHVPCPHCGEYQTLEFGGEETDFGIKWPKARPEAAFYLCAHCHKAIMNYDKHEMLKLGQWRATMPFQKTAGFHINQLYSNFIPWADIAADFLKAKASPQKLQVFLNVRLGLLFEEKHERISDESLMQRREQYGPMVPMAAALVTAGIDIQPDRIEISSRAWSASEESWDVGHTILLGDTAKEEVWKLLDDYLLCPFLHESGREIYISCAAIDSGYRTKQVAAFVRMRQLRKLKDGTIQHVLCIKGANTSGKPIISSRPSKLRRDKVHFYFVGTDTAKDTLMSYLKIDRPGPGCMHFMMDRDAEYFKQLTAEKKIKVYNSAGFAKAIWKKRSDDRNEALDCLVYAYAALMHLVMNMNYSLDLAHAALAPKSPADNIHGLADSPPSPPSQRRGRRQVSRGINT